MYIYLTAVTVQFEGATTINQTASRPPPITKCKSSLGDRHRLDQVGKQSEHCYKSRNSSSIPAAADSSYLYLSVNVSLMIMSIGYLLYMNVHH